MSVEQPDEMLAAASNAALSTGVLGEPVWPGKPPLAKFGLWMKSLFSFTSSSKAFGSFSWDDRHVVPMPGDQGQLQACICYAASLAAATTYRIKTGKLLSIAPRVMHLCTMKLEPSSGTNSRDFEDVVLASGLPFVVDATAAGQATAMSSQSQCGLFGSAPRLKVTAVMRFQTEDEVKAALSSTGPVVVHMKLFDDFWKHYVPGTVYSPQAGATPTTSHAVCLIGYDDTKQCWIGVNSKGPSWGSQGRFMLKYGACDVMATGAAAYALSIQA